MPPEWSRFSIANKRGQALSALLCRAQGAAVKPVRETVVIVCHGFTGSKEGEGRALQMGEALAPLGYSCLLFDFAGCGESEGRQDEISLSRHLEDLAAVVQWCRERSFSTIILNGRSFGGAVSLCYASSDPAIAGVCTWAAPARLGELFCKFAGGDVTGPPEETVTLTGEDGSISLRKSFFYDLHKYDLPACASRLSPRPLLVIHGTADEVVSPEEARLIAGAAGEPKKLILVEGADHRFSAHREQVWNYFFDWLKLHF